MSTTGMHARRTAPPLRRTLLGVLALFSFFAPLALGCSSVSDGAGDAAMRVDAVCL